jgi:hypothetical protein
MATNTIKLTNPKLTLATTEAGLTTGGDFECQVNSAVLAATGKSTTTAPTGCRPEVQSAGKSSWAWTVTWLQDWQDPDGLSVFTFDNDGATVWYLFEPDPTLYAGLAFQGQCDVVAGAAGGSFGDGSEVNATATWPAKDKPTLTPATVVP